MIKTGPNDPCHCGSGKKYKKCHMHQDRLQTLAGQTPPAPAQRATVRPGRQSPMRLVPAVILRPDYVANGKPGRGRGLRNRKGPEQVERMRHACRMAREVLDITCAAATPGVTTDELDAIAHAAALERGCYPSPLNYHGYPKSICTSVNEVICHGIPDDRPLADGDIVNIDVTVYVDGMHGDNSAMVLVGEVDEEGRRLVEVTHECLMAGIQAVGPGAKLNRIGRAIDTVAARHGFGVVRSFVGHGIGELFHMDPQVPHYYDPQSDVVLREGMTFTIEPMINVGTWGHVTWDDGWTAVTADGLRSAQWEHTVLVTDRGVEILTLPPGQAQPFEH